MKSYCIIFLWLYLAPHYVSDVHLHCYCNWNGLISPVSSQRPTQFITHSSPTSHGSSHTITYSSNTSCFFACLCILHWVVFLPGCPIPHFLHVVNFSSFKHQIFLLYDPSPDSLMKVGAPWFILFCISSNFETVMKAMYPPCLQTQHFPNHIGGFIDPLKLV